MAQQNIHRNQIKDQRKIIQGGYWDTADSTINCNCIQLTISGE